MTRSLQDEISDWASRVFGEAPGPTVASCVARALQEMAELVKLTATPPGNGGPFQITQLAEYREAQGYEAADVVIALMRGMSVLGRDLLLDVRAKMEINRQRAWHRDGTGHGYHCKGAGCVACANSAPRYGGNTGERLPCLECDDRGYTTSPGVGEYEVDARLPCTRCSGPTLAECRAKFDTIAGTPCQRAVVAHVVVDADTQPVTPRARAKKARRK